MTFSQKKINTTKAIKDLLSVIVSIADFSEECQYECVYGLIGIAREYLDIVEKCVKEEEEAALSSLPLARSTPST